MTLRRPSPSMVVAIIALVMATTGSAVAAVNFATNAGAVDGKSAVRSASRARSRPAASSRPPPRARTGAASRPSSSTSPRRARTASTFGQSLTSWTTRPSRRRRSAAPRDGKRDRLLRGPEPAARGAEPVDDPDLRQHVGRGGQPHAPRRQPGSARDRAANGATHTFRILGSNTFELHLERRGINYAVNGVVRQDNPGTAAAACLVYGYALTVPRQ